MQGYRDYTLKRKCMMSPSCTTYSLPSTPLNVYGTGPRIQRLVPRVTVLDGCIYIVGFVSGTGEITQMGKIFRLVYGAHKGTQVAPGILEAVQKDLQESGIKAEISPDINRDTFIKWSFISAMAVTGAYYDVPMGEVQKPGKVRDTFIGLSTESAELGRKLGVEFPEDPISYNLKVIDKLDPESTLIYFFIAILVVNNDVSQKNSYCPQ